ncbi:MAG TPA: hypothetical protein DCQ31_08600, partial [Bacteroidales bacterium]|nr:hypothetical protein [Bacteroidales bacterium]
MVNKLHELIRQGEGERLEFKTNFNTETIETLTAFANTKGGKVLLGVSDKKEIKGISLNSESIAQWLNEIKS